MKTRPLQNYGASVGLEAFDIDWNSQEERDELGRLCAQECVVFVNERIPTKVIFDTMTHWGDASRAFLHEAVVEKLVEGRHWRELLVNLGYISNEVGRELAQAVSIVSYQRHANGRPRGVFQNGELDWHSDQISIDESQRIIGLSSVEYTEGSATQFLCTHDAYESMSESLKSQVRELVISHKWRKGLMAPGLNEAQNLLVRYNMVPLDGMETSLYGETATGLPGLKMPTHTFSHFVGMTESDSLKLYKEICDHVYDPKYVYTCNWKDGQTVFMDQQITLHKRPTNILDGNKRLMTRTISFVNHILPNQPRTEKIRYQGQWYSKPDFLKLVDADRQAVFEKEQAGHYASLNNEYYPDEAVRSQIYAYEKLREANI